VAGRSAARTKSSELANWTGEGRGLRAGIRLLSANRNRAVLTSRPTNFLGVAFLRLRSSVLFLSGGNHP
jgi:hypothetical protein